MVHFFLLCLVIYQVSAVLTVTGGETNLYLVTGYSSYSTTLVLLGSEGATATASVPKESAGPDSNVCEGEN